MLKNPPLRAPLTKQRQARHDAEPMSTASAKVSRTRASLPAAKFCPTIGAAAKATAIAGRNIPCIIRWPMPNPACALSQSFLKDAASRASASMPDQSRLASMAGGATQEPPTHATLVSAR